MKATEAEFEQGKTFNIYGPLATLSLQTNLRINQSFMNNRENTLSKVGLKSSGMETYAKTR